MLEQGINWIKPICAAITESTFGLKKSGHSVSLPRETASPFTNPNQHRSDGVGRQRKVFPQSFLSSTFWQEQARGCYRVKHTTLQCLHDHLHIVACILFCVHIYIYIKCFIFLCFRLVCCLVIKTSPKWLNVNVHIYAHIDSWNVVGGWIYVFSNPIIVTLQSRNMQTTPKYAFSCTIIWPQIVWKMTKNGPPS